MYNLNKKLIVSGYIFGLMLLAGTNQVSAAGAGDCKPVYGGGETCIINKAFDIDKKVAREGDKNYKDKVVGVKKGEVVSFSIRIKNVGDLKTNDMKMSDILPDSLERVGGSGLTESWNNFEPGKTKEFIIKAKIKDSEFDRKNFEKCVVNKAEVYYKNKFEGADTATVCYGEATIAELPVTGPASSVSLSLAGISFIGLGSLIRRKLV